MGKMRYLIDTHVFLWWLFDDPKLPKSCRELIADPENEILVSSASAWEIATKHRLKKLHSADALVKDIADWVRRAGFVELPITIEHAQRAGCFDVPHRDPFDRMLAAQSTIESIPLVTMDKALLAFGIHVFGNQ
jgi:PIN domain nuclease of toxin-antitoxin system